jgi:hypothetical protein
MLRRVVQLFALMVLMVLPAWSSHTAQHCFRTCHDELYPNQCAGLPPEDQQACGDYVTHVCRCQCYPPEYCP